MSRIRGKHTRPEWSFRMWLVRLGRRFRMHAKDLPGTPDFAFDELKVAVFIDSCFWHCCPAHGKVPKSNKRFWRRKLAKNVARDTQAVVRLRAMGWHPLRLWTCQIKEQTRGRG